MSATTIQTTDTSNAAGVPPAPSEPHQQADGIALRALHGEGEAIYLPLGVLRLDERNVRKDKPSEAEIEELADLIDAQGLLQNLTVVAYPEPVKGKGKDKKRSFSHGVIAGGRRLRSLLLLVQRGCITLDEQVLCTVVAAERALAVSAGENSGRSPMSTADTILAFADMVRAGAGIEDLAVCFGLSPLTVKRRLRLANVSPKLFALFRDGAMTLDQLMALALTDDQDAQEAAWDAAPAYDRGPRKLRALIAGEGLSANVIRFVGMQAYEAAGGVVLRDLFAEDDEQPAYIQDPALMMRLAEERLDAIAQGLRDEGAAWVAAFTSFTYSERQDFAEAPSYLRAPTEQEAAELAALDAQVEKINDELEALYDESDNSDDSDDGKEASERIEVMEAQAEQLNGKRNRIAEGMRLVEPEVATLLGALVYIDHQGAPKIERNMLRKADVATAKRVTSKAAGAAGSASESASAIAGVSDRLCNQLTAHRTRALQASLIANPCAALAALVHPLLTRLVHSGSSWESPSALSAKAEDCESQLKTWAPDLEGSRSEQIVQEALAEARALLPEDVAGLLPWLLTQPMDTLLRLLTLCSALSLNDINVNGKSESTEPLAAAVGLKMAEWWEPTGASYLASVSKAMIVSAVTEAGKADDAAGLAKLKKGEAVEKAEALLAGTGWLPSVLR